MREVKKIEINGTFYAITPMDAIKSVKILAKLIKAYGGPLKEILLSKMGPDASKDAVNPETIGKAIDNLIEAIDPDELEKIILDLVKPDFVSFSDSENGSFTKITSVNSHFADRPLMQLFKLIKSILEVNYSDFLGEIVG